MHNHAVPRAGSQDIDQACRDLDRYLRATGHLLAQNRFSSCQIRELAAVVQNIRLLLKELDRSLHSCGRDSAGSVWVAGLHRCYWELEGMVKERRNDLTRRRTPADNAAGGK